MTGSKASGYAHSHAHVDRDSDDVDYSYSTEGYLTAHRNETVHHWNEKKDYSHVYGGKHQHIY